MIKLLTVWLAILLLCLAGGLQSADAKVSYPIRAEAGEFFTVDGSLSSATAGVEWQIADEEAEVWYSKDRRKLLCRVPTPRLIQMVAIARDTDGHNAVQIVTIAITGDAPTPAPDPPKPDVVPVPPKPPTPPTPPDVKPSPSRFGLTPLVTTEASKVKTDDRKAEAEQFAALCLTVRGKIVAGEIQASEPAAIADTIDAAVKTLPKTVQQKWLPTFGKWWTGQLRTLYLAGKLQTSKDWSDLIDETIAGLRAVQ